MAVGVANGRRQGSRSASRVGQDGDPSGRHGILPRPVTDVHLKLLADASLEAGAAEEALAEAAYHTALERLDGAAASLAGLREAWPGMSAGERAVIGPSASAVRARLDAARTRIPRLSALTVGTPESDPDEEREPPS
jgi:hypothetical protein